MPSIRTFFRHCPSCGRRFEIRLVSREEVNSESHVEELPASVMGPRVVTAAPIPRAVLVQEEKPSMVDVEEFQYTYKCRHCGHVWSEIRTQDEVADAPEGYTGD